MNLKKILALVLALVMVLSFASCDTGSKNQIKDGEVAQDPNLSTPGTEPIWIGEGTPTVSILMKRADHVTDYVNNTFTQRLEKDGNVKIAFEWLPAAEMDLAIRMKMISGEDLPMVLNYGLNISAAKDYAEAGSLINLAPYIESGIAHYTLENDTNNPELFLLSNITTAEGNIYGLPKYNAALSNETKFKLWVNIEWLKNLGMTREDIKTTDDFLKVMRRFKNEDANGNGDANDEIPFMPTTDFGGTAYKFLTNAFVYEGDDDMFQIVDGKVTTAYLQDGWYKAADFIKQLVDEGLLPSDGFTTNQNALKALMATKAKENGGYPMVGASTRSSNGIFKANNDYDFRLQYAALAPLKASADQATAYAGYTLTASQGHWYVTKDAGQYEQLCVRLGDVMQQEKYYIHGRFGDEGTNWMKADDYLKTVPNWDELVEDAKESYNLVLTDKSQLKFVDPYASMNIKGEYYWFNDTWSDDNANTWYDSAPTFSGVTESKGAQLEHTFKFEISNLYRQCEATIQQQNLMRTSSLVCPPLAFTDEETDELGTVKADIQTFLRKERVLYYTGNDCQLSKGKDSFIAELNKMGLDKLLKIYNRAYTRQYGN